MRALLISDHEFVARKIEATIESEDGVCHRTGSGEDGLQMAKLYDYDIVLLAHAPPNIRGDLVLRSLRNSNIDTPVLFLSECCEPESKIEMLRGGADDYMTKPLHIGELMARTQAIVRRSYGHADSVLRIGRLTLDLERGAAAVDGTPVPLRRNEYRFLELLAMRKGKIVTRDNVFDYLYEGRDEPCSKIIDVYICKLRKKLAAASGGDNFIETVWGRGYILCDASGQDGNVVEMAKAA